MKTLAEVLKIEFMAICKSEIKRDGIDNLLNWLENDTDFFTAPASTQFHGNYKYGLLAHSLNVYNSAKELVNCFNFNVSPETVALTSLFHDICKANFYVESTRNVKNEATGVWEKVPFYKIEDQFPVGHGEKSVILLMKHIKLTDEEIYAIRWHMSGFDNAVKGGDYGCSKAYEMYPFAALLHMADMTATYLMEGKDV